MSAADLEDQLWSRKLRECGALEMFHRGWTAPHAEEEQRLVLTVNRQHLIALGINQKLLPSSIIRQETASRAKALAQEQGHPVARRQLREIKDRVTTELRAKAFTRRKTMYAWLDPDRGRLIVDSASVPRAEELVESLRDALQSFAATPLDFDPSPQAAMGAWLLQGNAPLRFSIDQELELQAADKTKASVRYQRHPLEAKEVKAHLTGGKHVTRLGLTWNDRVAFVVTDKLQIKRVQFLEMAEEKPPEEEIGAAEKFATDFLLMANELGGLLDDLQLALGGAQRDRAAA